MNERRLSRDLKPGDTVIWVGIWSKGQENNHRDSILERRKETDDGWWCVGGGGLADDSIDDPTRKFVVAS